MDISTENDIVDISLYLNRQDNIHRPKSLITALNKYDLYYHKMTMAQMGSTKRYSPFFGGIICLYFASGSMLLILSVLF